MSQRSELTQRFITSFSELDLNLKSNKDFYDESLKELPKIILTVKDLILLISRSNPQRLKDVCTVLANNLSTIINSLNDLKLFLSSLEPTVFRSVFVLWCDYLFAMVPTLKQFNDLCLNLGDEKMSIIFEIIQKYAIDLAQSASSNAKIIFPHLNEESCRSVSNTLLPNLSTIFTDENDVFEMLLTLDIKCCIIVCEAWRSHFPVLGETVELINSMLLSLAEGIQSSFFSNRFSKDLDSIIVRALLTSKLSHMSSVVSRGDFSVMSDSNFLEIMQILDLKACLVFCSHLQNQLPLIIKTGEHFTNVLKVLDSEKRHIVYQAYPTNFGDVVKSRIDLKEVLKFLNPEDCSDACKRYLQFFAIDEHNLNKLIPSFISLIFRGDKSEFASEFITNYLKQFKGVYQSQLYYSKSVKFRETQFVNELEKKGDLVEQFIYLRLYCCQNKNSQANLVVPQIKVKLAITEDQAVPSLVGESLS